MADRLDHARILIYSHDSFGLGHLRRCRAIAHSLVARYKGVSVLILSGSPIIGSFDFRSRVDFVKIPGVIKLRNGEYTSLSLDIDIEHTVSLRASRQLRAPWTMTSTSTPLRLSWSWCASSASSQRRQGSHAKLVKTTH